MKRFTVVLEYSVSVSMMLIELENIKFIGMFPYWPERKVLSSYALHFQCCVTLASLECPVMESLQLHHFLTVWPSTICLRRSNDYDAKSTFRLWFLFLISDLLGMLLWVTSGILLVQVVQMAPTTYRESPTLKAGKGLESLLFSIFVLTRSSAVLIHITVPNFSSVSHI